jgi:hypothetical protein
MIRGAGKRMGEPAPVRRAALSARVRWFALLRRLVVRTSVRPLLPLHRWCYRLAIRLAVDALRRSPTVKAIYLRGGCAENCIRPGFSDIDLVVFTETPPDPGHPCVRRYRRLARLIPILDPWPVLEHAAAPQAEYDARARLRYTWWAGKGGWTLLYGTDILGRVETCSGADLDLGLLCYAGNYFAGVARRLWSPAGPIPDRPLSASIYYRCVASVLQMDLSAAREEPLDTRETALAEAANALSEERAFVEELRRLEASCFQKQEPGFEERATAFLLRRMDSFCARLGAGPFAAPAARTPSPLRHEPDGSLAELRLTAVEDGAIGETIHLARTGWGDGYRAAYLAPTVAHTIGDLVLALEIDPRLPPTPEQLRQVKRAIQGLVKPTGRRVLLYLLLPGGAVHLGDGVLLSTRPEWVMHPAAQPDFFALLQRDGFRLDGRGSPRSPQPTATAAMLHLLRENLWRLEHPEFTPGRPFGERADLTARFWKALQVLLVEASLPTGVVRYPVTPAAVERRLQEAGLPLPAELAPLREAVFDPRAAADAAKLSREADRFLVTVLAALTEPCARHGSALAIH